MRIADRAKEKILLMDGAMGTYYNRRFGGEMEAEEANLAAPERIISIHREYIEAGAELIRTNTFAVNHLLFPDRSVCRAAIGSAVRAADAAVKLSGKQVEICASIGPIRQTAEDEDETILEEFRFLIDAFLELGVENFVFETFAELKWIRPLAAYCRKQCAGSTVMAQFSLDPAGYTQYGSSMDEILRELYGMYREGLLDVLGFNCGVGALHLKKLLESEAFPGECVLSVLPNAGYQQELRGRMHYGDEPAYYAGQMEVITALGANIIGGCCGTTPGHIAALKRMLADAAPRPKRVEGKSESAGEKASGRPTEFIRKLRAGKKVFVVELDAPFDADAERFRKGVYALKESGVDMITVSDSPLARSRADAALLAVYAKRLTDIPVMPHVAMRDRNVIGLRSGVLGAHVNGIRDFLVITGDPVGPDNRGKITGVFDMNSIRFMEYLQCLNEETLGEEPVYYGGALNYAGANIGGIAGRMKKKMAAGCDYFLSQPVFSEEDIQRIRDLKELTGARIICGLMPLVSYRNALFMKNEMPGIHVDDRILNCYRPDMTREEAEETAVSICTGIAEKLFDTADGFYLMTPFHRVALVNRIIRAIRRSGFGTEA